MVVAYWKMKKTIYGNYNFRSAEMLLFLANPQFQAKFETAEREEARTVKKMKPLLPLLDYNDSHNRITASSIRGSLFRWEILPSAPVDLGAEPSVRCEITAVSYLRSFGSWDVEKHSKTYVELCIEGTVNVGDVKLRGVLKNCDNVGFGMDYDVKNLAANESSRSRYNPGSHVTYYVFDSVEVLISAPTSPKMKGKEPGVGLGRKPSSFVRSQTTLGSGYPKLLSESSPVARHSFRDKCCLTTSEVEMEPGLAASTKLSQIEMNCWYLDKERVTKMHPTNGIDVICTRSTSIDGRNCFSVTYQKQPHYVAAIIPNNNTDDAFRNSFDFRVQVQFYYCFPERHTGVTSRAISDSDQFIVQLRHRLLRVEHRPNYEDIITRMESPKVGMEKAMNIQLANQEWHKSNNLPIKTIAQFSN